MQKFNQAEVHKHNSSEHKVILIFIYNYLSQFLFYSRRNMKQISVVYFNFLYVCFIKISVLEEKN